MPYEIRGASTKINNRRSDSNINVLAVFFSL